MSEDALALPPALAARYAPIRVLGAGGFGRVVLAKDRRFARLVAIKLMREEARRDPTQVARFEREARLAAKVRGRHVAECLDLGHGEAGPYMVIAYFAGTDLRRHLDESGGRLAPGEARDLFAGCLDGLADCHRAGVVHRDVKPENVLLAEDGRPVLIDFGLARAGGEAKVTATGVLMGTPGYFPPEVLGGAAPGAAGDVYAAAVMGYELLAGARPYGDSIPRPGAAAPTALRPQGVEVPPAVDRCLRAALSVDPAARPPDAAAFLAAWREAWAAPATRGPAETVAVGSRTRPVEAAPSPGGAGARETVETAVLAPGPPPGRPGLAPRFPALVGLGVLAGGVIGWGLQAPGRRGAPPAPAPASPAAAPPAARPASAGLAARLERAREAAASAPEILAALDLRTLLDPARLKEVYPWRAPEDQTTPEATYMEWREANFALYSQVLGPLDLAARPGTPAARRRPAVIEAASKLLFYQRLFSVHAGPPPTINGAPRPPLEGGWREDRGLLALTREGFFARALPADGLSFKDFIRTPRAAFRGAVERTRAYLATRGDLPGTWRSARRWEDLQQGDLGTNTKVKFLHPAHPARVGEPDAYLQPRKQAASVITLMAESSPTLQKRWTRDTVDRAPRVVELVVHPFEGDLELVLSHHGWGDGIQAEARLVGVDRTRRIHFALPGHGLPAPAGVAGGSLGRTHLRVAAAVLPRGLQVVRVRFLGLQAVSTGESVLAVGPVLQRVGSPARSYEAARDAAN